MQKFEREPKPEEYIVSFSLLCLNGSSRHYNDKPPSGEKRARRTVSQGKHALAPRCTCKDCKADKPELSEAHGALSLDSYERYLVDTAPLQELLLGMWCVLHTYNMVVSLNPSVHHTQCNATIAICRSDRARA